MGDGAQGWQAQAPYDVIVYTGGLNLPPLQAQQQLSIGGRLFAVIGHAPVMEATMIRRIDQNSFRQDVLFETCLPVLENAPEAERFAF